MRWSLRLVGLAVLLAAVGGLFNYSMNEIEKIENRRPPSEAPPEDDDDQTAIPERTEQNETPEYLAFVGGIPSGVYRVAHLPGSDDWDFGELSPTPEAPSISSDNPVDDDVEVEDGPHATSAETRQRRDKSVTEPTDDAADRLNLNRTIGEDDRDDRTGDRRDDRDEDDEDADDDDDDGDGRGPRNDADLPSIKPGLYATRFGVDNCEYELRQILEDNQDHVIGHDHVHRGRVLVTLNEYEPDTFVSTESCGEWTPWSPLAEPLTVAGDGDYWVGDLTGGLWDVPDGCRWEKVVGFRGAQLADVQSSGYGPTQLLVDGSTLGVRVRQCRDGAMTLSDDPVPVSAGLSPEHG